MKIVVFGLSMSSSWGNGHATLWRGLQRALARAGHLLVFFERDVPYYADHRDLTELAGGELRLYGAWEEALPAARAHLADADVAMVTSYCPDALAATELVLDSRVPVRAFYDLDTPVTLDGLESGAPVPYIGPRGLADFDLVLSFTGGAALDALRDRLGARRVAPLYGSVDPDVHRPVAPRDDFRADISYLGTYAADRQGALETLLIEPARRRPAGRFVIGGAQYPQEFPWTPNIFFVRHIPPYMHPAFYCSSRITLNITRRAMAEMGDCPSGRLFEAAACGVPIVSDWWEGLDRFFTPGEEILVARDTADVTDALDLGPDALASIAWAARERVLAEHTAERRAEELVELLEGPGARDEGRGAMECVEPRGSDAAEWAPRGDDAVGGGPPAGRAPRPSPLAPRPSPEA
ncbi:MAG TPA: glycosyltransferase [Gemmatimonadaceae bacterium]|nr:glycosyltransferase [Gemmatimonadaceae bacterium]